MGRAGPARAPKCCGPVERRHHPRSPLEPVRWLMGAARNHRHRQGKAVAVDGITAGSLPGDGTAFSASQTATLPPPPASGDNRLLYLAESAISPARHSILTATGTWRRRINSTPERTTNCAIAMKEPVMNVTQCRLTATIVEAGSGEVVRGFSRLSHRAQSDHAVRPLLADISASSPAR